MLKATKKIACNKCNGTGRIQAFSHVFGGVCFECEGAGSRTVAATHKPTMKFGCVYGGELLFWIKARTPAEALRKAIGHWERHQKAPAMAAVTKDQISVVGEKDAPVLR